MHDADRLDLMIAVGGQGGADFLGIGTAAPVGLQGLDLQAMAARQFLPQMGELAGAGQQDAVAGGQRVDHRGLPRDG